MFKLIPTIAISFLLFTINSLNAEELWAHGQWNLQIENDVTFGDDGNYTNGLLLGWQSAPVNRYQEVESALPNYFNWQNQWLLDQTYHHKNFGLKLSQRMWTPSEIKIETPQPNDRPYAGVLELEASTGTYSDSRAQKNWLSIGMIGPAAGAEKLQKAFHSSTGSSFPSGWKYQIENTPIINLAYESDHLLYRSNSLGSFKFEASGYGYLNLSNLRSEANTGLLLRFGTNLADSFGKISSHYGHAGNIISQPNHSLIANSNLFFFTRAQLGYRFNDLTLTGDLPYESNVELEHKQARLDIGAVWAFNHFSATWSFNTYTKDYQSDPEKWHGYGSLTLSWRI